MAVERRKRKRTYNIPRQAHYLTYSCVDRLPLLATDRARMWVVDATRRAREQHDFELWAYVIMPEHVHALVYPRHADYRMQSILAALKRPVSSAAKRTLLAERRFRWLDRLTVRRGDKMVFRFWQPGGGFDRNVTDERSVHAIVDYIHDNPVRRGLISSAPDWFWSSAGCWAGRTAYPIEVDRPRF